MLGSTLCRIYHHEHEVHAFHRDDKCLAPCYSDYCLDLMDKRQLQLLLSKINPEMIIHCAGLISVDACEKEPELAHVTNVTTTENVAYGCSKDTKVVYISSDQVYGKANDHSEIFIDLHPVNHYGKTKLLGEQKVQKLCENHIIIRTNIFGWNVKPGRISSAEWIHRSIMNGEEIKLYTDYSFSPIYTECLAEIIMQLQVMDFTGVINVGSPTPCSKYEFGIQVAVAFGLSSFCISKGYMDDYSFSKLRFNKLDLNVKKLVSLDLVPPDYKYSIRQFAQYWNDQYCKK